MVDMSPCSHTCRAHPRGAAAAVAGYTPPLVQTGSELVDLLIYVCVLFIKIFLVAIVIAFICSILATFILSSEAS